MAELCDKCECGCKLISMDCLVKHTVFDDPTVVGVDNYTKATMEVDDLIGEDCAKELCEALEAAAQTATDAADGSGITDHLETKWLTLISNKWFKAWYANRVAYHYFNGTSIGEIKEIGIIFNSGRDSAGNDYDSGTSASKERHRLENASKDYATTARTKFLTTFWNKNRTLYSCAVLECGCSCSHTCDKHSTNSIRPDFQITL